MAPSTAPHTLSAIPAAPDDDGAVMRRSLAEPRAFAEIFDRHAPALLRYLAARVGPDVAEDLASEAFAIAFDRRATWDGAAAAGNARPWLYGIASNLVHRHREAEATWLRRCRAAAVPDLAHADLAAVVERIDSHRLAPALATALAELKARDREALVLFAVSGASYAEVAHALGIRVGTLRSRLNRARRIVQASLAVDAVVFPLVPTTPLEPADVR